MQDREADARRAQEQEEKRRRSVRAGPGNKTGEGLGSVEEHCYPESNNLKVYKPPKSEQPPKLMITRIIIRQNYYPPKLLSAKIIIPNV